MKTVLKSVVFLLLVGVLVAAGVTFAQTANDPESVGHAFEEAANAHDIELAMSYFADDAVWFLAGDPTGLYYGKDAIRANLEGLFAQNYHLDVVSNEVTGDVRVGLANVSLDTWTGLGIAPLQSPAQMVIRDGKIKTIVVSLTPESGEKLGTALAQLPPADDPVSILRTGFGVVNAGVYDPSATFADDAVITVIPPPPGTNGVISGSEALAAWIQDTVNQHIYLELTMAVPTGPNTAVALVKVSLDPWRDMGIESTDNVYQVVTENGKIKYMSISMTPESGARLGAALASQ